MSRLCNYLSKVIQKRNNILSVASIFNTTSPILKCDSGASKHSLNPFDISYVQNITKMLNGPTESLPDSTKIHPSHQATIPIFDVAKRAQEAFIFPHIKNSSLLSIGQLCDNNC